MLLKELFSYCCLKLLFLALATITNRANVALSAFSFFKDEEDFVLVDVPNVMTKRVLAFLCARQLNEKQVWFSWDEQITV